MEKQEHALEGTHELARRDTRVESASKGASPERDGRADEATGIRAGVEGTGSEGARVHGNVILMVVVVVGGGKGDWLGAGSGHGVVVRVCQCVCRLRQVIKRVAGGRGSCLRAWREGSLRGQALEGLEDGAGCVGAVMDDEERRGDRELEWFGRNPRPGNIARGTSTQIERS